MSCSGNNCSCGCCAGISMQTPQLENNLPGLPAIAYRAGTWSTFKQSMLARLSSSKYPAFGPLKTRDDDDFSIAFLDAAAVLLDILTFYQERLANESYLRTATQRRSLTELSRLIGYQPAPGVSASAYVAFTLRTAPGSPPDPSTPAIVIPAGTQMQSVPAQGQSPLTFETSAPIQAKPDWNALPVQTGVPWLPKTGDKSVYLAGTTTQLQPGDLMLIVGDERLNNTGDNHWDLRVVTAVTPDTVNKRTLVQWSEGLGGGSVGPTQQHPLFYAMRQRASLFGYNAADPNMLDLKHTNLSQLVNTTNPADFIWYGYALSTMIDLDSLYPKITPESWLAMIAPDNQITRSPAGYISLYKANSVSPVARAGFGMSAKITRVAPDLAIVANNFPLNKTSVAAQSEQLPAAEQPLDYPLYGACLDLETVRPDLVGIQVVAISGKSQKLSVNALPPSAAPLTFVPDDGSDANTLNPGDVLTILDPTPLPLNPADGLIPDWITDPTAPGVTRSFLVQDSQGRSGSVTATLQNFTLTLASSSDPDVEECALVSSIKPFPHTQLRLKSNLLNCYDRTLTKVNANVGLATHGSSVTEVLGSGSASTPGQSFKLKQSPLTYIQSPTPTGRLSTLQVKANGVAWKEVGTLYGQGAAQAVFETQNQYDGTSIVQFGDGVEGATLPTGTNNIVANYRIGSGAAGNVAAGALTTLLDRPIGVSGVNNPQAAAGGQDSQTVDGIRSNAPQTVLTLGRAVSLADYQNFASTFAGISKALAIWIPSGPARGVFLTVAGVNGAALPPGNPTLANLVSALQEYGNPEIPIYAATFLETLFGLVAAVKYDPSYDQPTVEDQIQQALTTAFGFANRTFGQGVTGDQVAAIIQGVAGVIAVNVTGVTPGVTSKAGDLASEGPVFSLSRYNAWVSQPVSLTRPNSGSPTWICPCVPLASAAGLPNAAEILVLDPNPGQVTLGAMA